MCEKRSISKRPSATSWAPARWLGFALYTAVALTGVACRKEKPTPRRTLTDSEATNLIRRTPEFRAGILTMRVPRSIAVEPKIGESMAPRFAQTLGRELYGDAELQLLVPVLVAMRRDSLLSIHDSPISETYGSASGPTRGVVQGILTADHQRSQRYWRHYLAVTPANEVNEDWVAESGTDEIDESIEATRLMRTPGWRAVLARREVAAIASVAESNDTVTVRYRWRWQATQLGAPFVNDSATAQPLASTGAPKISRDVFEDVARFLRAPGGWQRLDGTLVGDLTPTTP
jgi:hypothetical protein